MAVVNPVRLRKEGNTEVTYPFHAASHANWRGMASAAIMYFQTTLLWPKMKKIKHLYNCTVAV